MACDISRVLDLLFAVNQLKRIPRMGWLLRGIGATHAESVAEHTYGTALTALFLSELVQEPVDRGRLLAICLLHDLPEAKISDLAPSAVRYLTPGAKHSAEQTALVDILAGSAQHEDLLRLWEEFEQGRSIEGRLARDADRIDMLIQAANYERSGWRGLQEFWDSLDMAAWEFPASRQVFQELLALHDPSR
jgi:putative hydrolase of HD superfamily